MVRFVVFNHSPHDMSFVLEDLSGLDIHPGHKETKIAQGAILDFDAGEIDAPGLTTTVLARTRN